MSDVLSQEVTIHVPLNGNKLIEEALARINTNIEIKTLWKVINTNAIDRLGMSDHGPVHFQIVSNIALRLARMLTKNQVTLSICKNFGLTTNHGELVVLLASLFHDLGMSINREGHEEFSLFLANNLLHETLDFLPIDERTIVISETLHAIISHRSGGKPLTLEAGIVRVADALDMSRGRSRVTYQAGQIDIYSVSAYAVDDVEIVPGKTKPIQINIAMNNSAGIFQVDELLKSKIEHSGIEKYLEVKAFVKNDKEERLIEEYNLS